MKYFLCVGVVVINGGGGVLMEVMVVSDGKR
jgi:hypothetical protein